MGQSPKGRHMTNEVKNNLRPNQHRAIEALLNGMTKAQASAAAGVQPSTLSRWLNDADFRAGLAAAGDVAVKDAATRLKASLDDAIGVMRDVMLDGDNPASIRLRAADMVANHAIKLIELADLTERLEKLERLRDFQN